MYAYTLEYTKNEAALVNGTRLQLLWTNTVWLVSVELDWSLSADEQLSGFSENEHQPETENLGILLCKEIKRVGKACSLYLYT